MIAYLIRWYLKLTHRHYLIQFVDGLLSIGRPTDVLYPIELLEQAALLGLSGLNNTLAIHGNQHWVWPYWVEKQLNPDADAFIPTGVNLLTNNLSYRNWTALSIPGSRWEAMIDPVGMLTLEPFSWSVLPYLIIDEVHYIPSKMSAAKVKQVLHKKSWPEVITRYKTKAGLQWQSRCKALNIEQQQVLQLKYLIKNNTEQVFSIIFGLSIRPYNPLTIGHIHKLSCKKNLWKVNGQPALLMLDTPDKIAASNRLLGDPIYSAQPLTQSLTQSLTKPIEIETAQKIKLKSRSGISAGIASYQLTLQPGETVNLQFLLADKQSELLHRRRKRSVWKKAIKQAEQTFKDTWSQPKQLGLGLIFPDKKIHHAFVAVKNHLYVFDDVDHFTPGSFFYHSGWFRDSAFLALGFDQLGFSAQVKNKIPAYFKLQMKNGYFKSQNGEWDSTGQALFTIISHIRRTGDIDLLRKHYQQLLKGGQWIKNTRLKGIEEESPHYGLLPAGLSAEHFGPNDHYYWDNFWSISGLEQLVWCSQKLACEADTHALNALLDEYQSDLLLSINNVCRRIVDGALPISPYRWMDTAAIGNLAAITPMNVVKKDEVWVSPTINFLWQNNVKDGLFFQHIIHSGYNIYLSIQLAKVLLIRFDERWKIIFKAVLKSASSTWTWPEAIHPKTGGGCMGDGDHGWAAAEFVSLVRDMFVFEDKEALYLGAGIFSEWYNAIQNNNELIEVCSAATLHGTISYRIEIQNEVLIFCWSVIRNELQEKNPVYFVCPYLLNKYQVGEQHQLNADKTQLILSEDSGSYSFQLL